MTVPGNLSSPLLATAAEAAAAAAGPIKSVRINSGDNAKLTRTPSSAGNRKTWTWAGWVKLNKSSSNFFLGAGTTGTTNYTYARFGVFSNKIQFLTYGQYIFTSDALFRDYSGWGHITLVCDTTESTAADRLKVYWNGVQLTNSATTTLDSNGDYAFNNTLPHTIGSESTFGTWDGYLADLYFIDGSALDPTSFGAFDDNGVWQAAAYSGTYGTNGYHLLDFASESGIGSDSSGNDNDFTVNNLQADGLFNNQGFTNPGNAFDGNTGTYAEVTTSAALGQFVFPGGISVSSSVKIKYSSGTSGNVYLNGSATALAGTGAQEHNISFTGTLNTIGIQSSSKPVIYYIDIDNNGTYLTGGAAEDQDVLRDVPTNGDSSDDSGAGGEVSGNYATWNPLDKGSGLTLANGNLQITSVTNDFVRSTIAMTSGKWYAEYTHGTGLGMVGIANASGDNTQYLGQSAGGAGYYSGGTAYFNNNGGTSYGASYTTGDVIGVALDADTGGVTFYKNGVSQGALSYTGFSSGPYFFACGVDTMANSHMNFGQRSFSYTPPSNYLPLSTTNLPTPTIPDGSAHFDTALWSGTGSARSITMANSSMSPDFVWAKVRNHTYFHYLFDSVRGATKELNSNATAAENTDTANLTSFDSNGFSLGTGAGVNQSGGKTYVGWAWDAGSSTVSNTDGSITSSVRANQTAGFSIVSWSGSGANATIGHGLNAAPEFIILKDRDYISSWYIYHKGVGNNKYLAFDTGAAYSSPNAWNSTDPTSSVFSVISNVNSSGSDIIAYCFAPVAGFSAFDSYEGNGSSTDGPFVHTGFRVNYLLVKNVDSTSPWFIFDAVRDPENTNGKILRANDTTAEFDGGTEYIDFLSNGFKLRTNIDQFNKNGDTYIYWAIAENPFQANGGLAR